MVTVSPGKSNIFRIRSFEGVTLKEEALKRAFTKGPCLQAMAKLNPCQNLSNEKPFHIDCIKYFIPHKFIFLPTMLTYNCVKKIMKTKTALLG
jgi:hypothetical protein